MIHLNNILAFIPIFPGAQHLRRCSMLGGSLLAHITTWHIIHDWHTFYKAIHIRSHSRHILEIYFETINMNGICPIFSNIRVNFCFIMNPSRALHFFFSILFIEFLHQKFRRHRGDGLLLYHNILGPS